MKSTLRDRIAEGITLIKESLSLYEAGEYEKALEMSGKGELMVSESVDRMGTEDGADEVLYGDNINFGAVYHVFESNAGEMLKTQSDKVGKIMSAISKDKVLLVEFKIYNALTNPENVKDAKSYTESVISMAGVHNKEELKEANRKLVRLMRKMKIDECVDIPSEDAALYESIEYVITTKPSITKAAQYDNTKAFITEEVSKRNIVETDGVDKTFENRMNEIAERYSSVLTDDEKEFISEVSAPNVNRKEIFESNKEWLLNVFKTKMKEDARRADEWKAFSERVENKQFSEKTALSDIAEMLEIKDVLNE